MPFVARHAVTHARIDITQIPNPRETLHAEDLLCQLCDERMIVRHGLILRPHFAHRRACTLPYTMHPESPEHLLGKAQVSAWLRTQPGFTDAQVELEVPIHARKRIADILVTFPQGHRLAVEIQLASLTTEALTARTKDYLDDGIDIIWVLGKDALRSPSNCAWCTLHLGGYLRLDFVERAPLSTIALSSADGGDAPTATSPDGVHLARW